MIELGPQLCGTLAESTQREWLVADGLGGYAMGTVSGLRTRRYHGLLVVAAGGPSARMLGLVALEPVLVVGDARHRLAVDEWASGAVDPSGFRHLVSFSLDHGIPRWRWQIGDVVVERELAMTHGRSAVGVVHRVVRAPVPVRLEVAPLCTWRSAHGERFAAADPDVEMAADGFVFEGAYRVVGPDFRPAGSWYRGVAAREEAARGLQSHEDVWGAGTFAAELEPGGTLEVTAAAAPFEGKLPAAASIVAAARTRAKKLVRRAGVRDGAGRQLVLAADAFVIDHGGPTAVAGYPWFGEWSRDLMTSYEGLFLSTGRTEEGRETLRRAAGTLSEGMLANTADTGTLEYNTADGTLWFAHAAGRHVRETGDEDLADELAPTLAQIVEHHLAGTRYGIRVDDDGLLRQGEEGVALTWMDARIDGNPVTPRVGKPVEVNALWLRTLAVARAFGRTDRFDRAIAVARTSFLQRFVRADGGGLLDVVDGPGGDDPSVRPNQLLAVSLPDGPLARVGEGDPLVDAAARAAVDACRTLLTPLGLRSLAPTDPAYRPYHRGSPAQRDAAYHEGTVWPWLIGPYVDAATLAGRPVEGLLDGLLAHLGDWGLGSVSETADGAAPHAATGCPFQAWSVAEVLRVRGAAAP